VNVGVSDIGVGAAIVNGMLIWHDLAAVENISIVYVPGVKLSINDPVTPVNDCNVSPGKNILIVHGEPPPLGTILMAACLVQLAGDSTV
jgi:hypothetical protein